MDQVFRRRNQMTTEQTMAQFEKYVIANYTRTPIVFVRGEGSRLWDADDNEYLDLFPGWGVNGLGHCHPRVVDALRDQAGKLLHVANNFYMEPQGHLAEMLSTRSFGGQAFFCNSGAEANESALKLARLAGGDGRYKVITFNDGFHGRTLAAISATAQPKYHKGLEPIVGGFSYAPINDLAAVEELIDDETCAIMVEPIQGEGGVNICTPEFLSGLRDLCDKNNLSLIFDEVQTGCGRLGEWFGYQLYNVTPDIMTLAKALGGGVAIGAMMAKPEVAKFLIPGTHASTFGGNPLACAAAIATLETIEDEDLLTHVRDIGESTMAHMEGLRAKFDCIKDVRGRGVMLGMELAIPGNGIVRRCMEKGVLLNCTHDTIIRMLPAMTVTWDEMQKGLAVLEESMAEELA
jgi:acetylornithine/N-succinyldiaminopimelate aminotransferase